MSKAVITKIEQKFRNEVLGTHGYRGDDTVILKRDKIVEIVRFLKESPDMAFDMPIDVTAVDYLERVPRFDVVIHLYSTVKGHRIRIKVPLDEKDARMPSLTQVYKGTNWFEREVYDMFGIVFENHPDLRRILLYDEFEGHPLRKDYPLGGHQPVIELRDVGVPAFLGPPFAGTRNERGFGEYNGGVDPQGLDIQEQKTPYSPSEFQEESVFPANVRKKMAAKKEKPGQ